MSSRILIRVNQEVKKIEPCYYQDYNDNLAVGEQLIRCNYSEDNGWHHWILTDDPLEEMVNISMLINKDDWDISKNIMGEEYSSIFYFVKKEKMVYEFTITMFWNFNVEADTYPSPVLWHGVDFSFLPNVAYSSL